MAELTNLRLPAIHLTLLLVFLLSALWPPARGADGASEPATVTYPQVVPGRTLVFPRDHGAHPRYRTEWWYITGWIDDGVTKRGFQITFFRNRPGVQEHNPSKFAPQQLIFAHAAIADPHHGRLIYAERAAREGFGLAYARAGTTNVAIDDWQLVRTNEQYRARVVAENLAMELRFVPTQPVLLQGRDGYSRKGPQPGQASYYYSLPQLRVDGSIRLDGQNLAVSGEAWLDHEWSSEYLPADAEGWDWVSVNFSDGGALMAFRMRAVGGGTLWAGGSVRDKNGSARTLSRRDVEFQPVRYWRSPRTGIEYPVAMRVRAGTYRLELEPLLDDQELDSRNSTGVVYWEGAVCADAGGTRVGRGYLELTGYGGRPGM